ncbi:late embryogenesis abundant protein D-34-like [Senna tora]|uniref:Late embryogenesis abundant protein D-34-like n=1 Tax=Senna tora TaxID=362788 RepID=A0A834SVR6_9FABA|nr:late embryogenesis abundant protein D-34-like [Senna tora]
MECEYNIPNVDAEGVMSAKMRNSPNVGNTPGGVAASVAAAARLNQNVNL